MKAVIPVAGIGTQLRPLTYTQPKPLIPVAGKTIISFIIDQLRGIGITDFVFIIGYLGEKIRDFIEENYCDLNVSFVEQHNREGSGHAILMAKELLEGEEEIYIFYGDTIIEMDFQKVFKTPSSTLCIKKVEDPREFGIVEIEDDKVIRVIEKPVIPKSNLAMVGFYKILEVDKLIQALEYNVENDIRTEGEFPLTDALMHMIDNGVEFSTVTVDNWFDCGKKEILLETNAILLDKEGYASDGIPNFDNTIVIHPVSIGSNCHFKNAIIGPHVTVGNNTNITSSIVKNSIIGNYSALKEIVMQGSVIGNDTAITGTHKRLNIGDNTEIDLS